MIEGSIERRNPIEMQPENLEADREKLRKLEADLEEAEVRNDTDAQADIDADIAEIRERLAKIESPKTSEQKLQTQAEVPAEKKGFFSRLFGRK